MRTCLAAVLGAALLTGCGEQQADGFSWDRFVDAFDPDVPEVRVENDVLVDAGPDAADVSEGLGDGEPCAADGECLGGACLLGERWPGGYCSSAGCLDATDCASASSACLAAVDDPVCLGACGEAGCREGYDCVDVTGDGGTVCLPTPVQTLLPDGRACTAGEECLSGTCLPDPDWPGGHCTTIGCRTADECALDPDADIRCLFRPDQNLCARLCEGGVDCRDGYRCQPLGGGINVCLPDVAVEEPDPIEEDDSPWEVHCEVFPEGGTAVIEYDIAETTAAYMVVPWTRDGRSMAPYDVLLPDGTTLDLRGANAFQIANSYIFGWFNPIVVPAIPRDAERVMPGRHVLRIESSAAELCWVLHEEAEVGSQLAMNIFFVGTTRLRAATAGATPEFVELLDRLGAIFAAAGVVVGAPNLYDVPEPVASRYAVPRSTATLDDLFRISAPPESRGEEPMAINVFLTRAFAMADAPGVIGISYGLPGPAGLHGTRASGVTFTSEFLFDGSAEGVDLTAVVMAHEIGHYLGLFHTTESDGSTSDPLEDTPSCRGSAFPDGCPDQTNLMFPFAGTDHRTITADQAFQLLRNPLTRP